MAERAFQAVTGEAGLADMAVRMAQAGAPQVPLIRAALEEGLNVAMVQPRGRVPLRFLDPVRHPGPLVVVLGGDGPVAAGPDAFPQALRLLRWARAIMVHGAGGDPRHYTLVVQAARVVRRVLVVECTSADMPAWMALRATHAPETATLGIAVRPGDTHPNWTAPAGTVVQ